MWRVMCWQDYNLPGRGGFVIHVRSTAQVARLFLVRRNFHEDLDTKVRVFSYL